MTTINPSTDHATLPKAAAAFTKRLPIRARYDNWIGGEYSPPARGQYFSNPTPVTGQHLCDVARSTHEDVDKALDAAHAAALSWNAHLSRIPREHPQPDRRPPRSRTWRPSR